MNWLSGSRPVYGDQVWMFRAEAVMLSDLAPALAASNDEASYDSESSRNFTYFASLIVKSRSGPPLKYWASSLGSVFCGCTYSRQVWKIWQRMRMLLSSRLKPETASNIPYSRKLLRKRMVFDHDPSNVGEECPRNTLGAMAVPLAL